MNAQLEVLAKLLAWLTVNGGAIALAYWVVGKVPKLEALRPDYKRYAATAIAAILAAAAFAVEVASGIQPAPVGFWPWVNALLAVEAIVFTGSQAVHAARELRQKEPAQAG